MRILMMSRATSRNFPGGDTIQMKESAASLRKLGLEVDIMYADEKPKYSQYNIIHFFNIIRPADILAHINHDIPFIVSAIYVDYEDVEKSSKNIFRKSIAHLFNPNTIEQFKAIARHILGKEKIQSFKYLLCGHKSSILKIVKLSKSIIFITDVEKKRFESSYQPIENSSIIPNGINTSIFKKESINESREGVISVARFEPRKNQIKLIEACKKLNLPLKLIGKADDNHSDYYSQCKNSLSNNMEIIDFIPHDILIDYYKKAKIHALPSYFECSPLSTLEAMSMGCIPVISNTTDDKDYYSQFASYCDADEIDSIVSALEKASTKSNHNEISHYIQNEFTWDNTATKIYSIYKSILNES